MRLLYRIVNMSAASSDELCREQFKAARIADANFVHAYDADDYAFGVDPYCGPVRGTLVTSVLPYEVQRNATVLDIGAGYGTFLEAVRHVALPGDNLRTIGFTAVRNSFTAATQDIEWVYGDFQRPATWRPSGTLQPESIDMAVSELTYQHFADPLRALKNAWDLLKPGGHLLINDIRLNLHPNHSKATVEKLYALFDRNRGSLSDDGWFDDSRHKPVHALAYAHLHIHKNEPFPDDDFMATWQWHGKLVYSDAASCLATK